MERKRQLALWVEGKSVHNDEFQECCPDFSCCGSPIADKETRVRFARAYHEKDEETLNQMLVMFLGGAFPEANVVTNDYNPFEQTH